MLFKSKTIVLSYFESKSHASFIGCFSDEETYDSCSEVLEEIASQDRMITTESILENDEVDSFKELESCEFALRKSSKGKLYVVALFVEFDVARHCLRILNRNSVENFSIVKITK